MTRPPRCLPERGRALKWSAAGAVPSGGRHLGQLAPSDGVKSLRGTLHSDLGDALRAGGQYEEARKAYEAALKIAEELKRIDDAWNVLRRELHADGTAPQPPAGCTGPSIGVLKGAGVFRFQDGSLLIVTLKDGTGCVNLVERFSALIVNYEINGGTGRFANASGELTMTATQTPVLRNATNAPALLPIVGEFEGTIVRPDAKHEDR